MKRIIALMLGVAACAAASADYTYVANPHAANPGGGGEWNLFDNGSGNAGIMEFLYGVGNFTRWNDDFDQIWTDGSGPVSISAKYAGNTQQFGWRNLGSTAETPIGSPIVQNLYPTHGGPTYSVTIGGAIPFAWFIDTDGSENRYSLESLNYATADQMVTFMVNGYLATPGDINSYTLYSDGPRFVLGFEDIRYASSDKDFNDLVVEVGVGHPIPVPAAATLGLIGLGIAAWVKRRSL